MDFDAAQSPGGPGAYTLSKPNAVELSSGRDAIKVQVVTPPSLVLNPLERLSITSTAYAPLRHVGFASRVVTMVQIDDISEDSANGSKSTNRLQRLKATGNGIGGDGRGRGYVTSDVTSEATPPAIRRNDTLSPASAAPSSMAGK